MLLHAKLAKVLYKIPKQEMAEIELSTWSVFYSSSQSFFCAYINLQPWMMCYGIFCDFCMFLKFFAGSAAFSRKHPLACYVSSMLMCFATSIVSNFLVGESLVIPLKNHQELIVASAVWYDLLRDGVSRCFIFLCLSVRQKSVYCCATEYSQPVHHQLVRKISGKTPSSCKHNANPNAHPTTKQ